MDVKVCCIRDAEVDSKHDYAKDDGYYLADTNEFQKPPDVKLSYKDKELIRIIGQYLRNSGLHDTFNELMAETNCKLDNPLVVKFQSCVMSGNWSEAENCLPELKLLLQKEEFFSEMKFLLTEQRYFELLADNCPLEALKCLQQQLTPLSNDMKRIHDLCVYLMCSSEDELKLMSGWSGKGLISREKLFEKLETFISPSVLVPHNRLKSLLHQATEFQTKNCPNHFSDNDCSRSLIYKTYSTGNISFKKIQIMTFQDLKVKFCCFSKDGSKLAVGTSDTSVTVWDLHKDIFTLTLSKTLEGHTQGVEFLAWSPDDSYLVACGSFQCPDLWVWNIKTEELCFKIDHTEDSDFTTCEWNQKGTKLVCGGIRGTFHEFDIGGNILTSWKGLRIKGLSYNKGGDKVLIADSLKRIREYNFENNSDVKIFEEKDQILSLCCHETKRTVLLCVKNQGVHLWDIKEKMLLREFPNSHNGCQIVHSCFGGKTKEHFASASEGGEVYVWYLKRSDPIATLEGHLKCVNSVSWNPVHHNLIASASEDGSVRVWLLEDVTTTISDEHLQHSL